MPEGPVETMLHEMLTQALAPLNLRLVNDSARHAGHAGAGAETHFTLFITAAAFTGKSRIERHRQVHDVLAEALRGPVHALVIKASAPGERAE